MEIASKLVRRSMLKAFLKNGSLARLLGDYAANVVGSPQFAYDTYGPRSTMMICAFSSNLRRRAAREAPPATPPTMMTFMIFSV